MERWMISCTSGRSSHAAIIATSSENEGNRQITRLRMLRIEILSNNDSREIMNPLYKMTYVRTRHRSLGQPEFSHPSSGFIGIRKATWREGGSCGSDCSYSC